MTSSIGQSPSYSLGANTFGFFWSHSASQAIELLSGMGYDHFDLICAPPHLDLLKFRASGLSEMRGVIGRSGVRVASVNIPSLDQNLASPCEGMRDFSVRLYEEAIALAADLGASSVAVLSGRQHALGSAPKGLLEASYRMSVDRIVAAADKAGITVTVENHPLGLLDSAGTIEAFLRSYDGKLGLLYDVANAVAINEDPAAGIRQLAGFIRMVHLSDAHQGQWQHNPIGDGSIDFASIGQALTEIGYRGDVVLELMGDDPASAFETAPAKLRAAGFPASLAGESNPT